MSPVTRLRPRNQVWRAAVCCAALLFGTAGCGAEPAPTRRALIVGIDGATLDVVRPLIEAGRLPNLASLANAGVLGELVSALPIQSPRIWNTIATGKAPRRHGILSFTFDAPNGERRLYLSHHRKVPALWNILTHHGVSVSAVNWWNTWPPEFWTAMPTLCWLPVFSILENTPSVRPSALWPIKA